MGNPNFPINGQGERIDALVDTAGAVYLKLGVGSIAVTGATSNASWHGVATHVDGSTANSSDGVVLGAGRFGTTVRHFLTDTNGNQQIIGPGASAAAISGNPVRVAGSDGTNTRDLLTDTLGNLLASAGPGSRPTYVVSVQGKAPTGTSHIIAIEAPSGAPVYIRRVVIWQAGTDTSNGIVAFELVRTTTAGSSGTVTPAQMDNADSAYGGIARSMGTGGTLGTVLFYIPLDVPNAAGAGDRIAILDFDGPRMGKGPVIPSGTANGIALYSPGATGAANFGASIEFCV